MTPSTEAAPVALNEWRTCAEVAPLVRRTAKTVRNQAARLKLKRRLVRLGRHPRRTMLLPPASVAQLVAFFCQEESHVPTDPPTHPPTDPPADVP